MAGKRVSKSSIDWKTFASAVSENDQAAFAALRSRNGAYVAHIATLPDQLPKIDFDKYKNQAPAMSKYFDDFAKQYAAIKIAYPLADSALGEIDKQEKENKVELEKFAKDSEAKQVEAKEALHLWDSIPPVEQLTHQEWQLYFPGLKPDDKTHAFKYGILSFYARNHPYTYYYEGNYRVLGGGEPSWTGGDPAEVFSREAVEAPPVNHHKGT